MLSSSALSEEQNRLFVSLQQAAKGWKSFDWPSKAPQWDATTNQNKEARDASQVARKQLSEHTKSFKKSVKNVETAGNTLGTEPNEENIAAAVKAIENVAKLARVTVKSYQEEIDNLTRRSKATESAFDKLAQALGEAQDPTAFLVAAIEQMHTQQQQIQQLMQNVEEITEENANLETKLQKAQQQQVSAAPSSAGGMSKAEKEELIQLRREVAEYEVEFRSLKNQDITIRKLEARIIELQQGGEEEFQNKLEAAKQELAETEGRRTAEALEREAAMERRVESLELQLKAEMAGRAATQAHLLEASEGAGEREAAWEAQRRILVDDSERVRVMLHEATRERDELRLKVAALEGSNGGGTRASPSSGGVNMSDLLIERQAYEAEVAELSHTVNSLREELSLKDNAISDEKQTLKLRIDVLEQEVSKLTNELSHMAMELEAAPSQSLVDSMKRELRILKRLEYNADDPDLPESNPEIAGEDQEKDLESVLVAKLRRVESELVRERNHVSEIRRECDSLRAEKKELEKLKSEADGVIASLEKDLDRAISSSSSPSKPRQKKSPLIAPSDPNTLQIVLEPDSVPPSATPMVEAQPSQSISAAEKAADDHSVATIIMAQRDRLRARCEALEAERDSFKRELQVQVDAAESLKADNTKLFEKMRYLQSFNSGSSNRSSTYARQNSRDLDLEALEQRYEASVDPFRQFSKSERQRKLNEMSPMERTVFVVAKAMLGTKEMRTFLFFYVLAMHMLVFLTTYHWSHSDSGHDCQLVRETLSHLPPVDTRGDIPGAASST
ncbi:CASP C terminal-domain containing protein [Nitzschia inconspicua]|uniref:Protein CASP n=1 Tax=Nitzschia inconspicua TaxID=303405 RepID=A0A9K3Q807_9STRA|nr:CASP C terminal-domain containing protein [Nitzschia inconspicua]